MPHLPLNLSQSSSFGQSFDSVPASATDRALSLDADRQSPIGAPLPLSRETLPIDWAQLHLLSEGNEEFELELLTIFWSETQNRLQLAQTAVLNADLATLQYVAHQMKGASGNVGLQDVWRIASALEKMAHCGDLTGADTLLLELSRCLNYVQAFLQGL
jgi:histidine phosphotransfer protein HptB